MKFISNKTLFASAVVMCTCYAASTTDYTIQMTKICWGKNSKKNLMTKVQVNETHDGIFTVIGAFNADQEKSCTFKGKYLVRGVKNAKSNKVKISTYIQNGKKKEKRDFYVKYNKNDGAKFMTWLNKCRDNSEHIKGGSDGFLEMFATRQEDGLSMYMDQGNGSGNTFMVLEWESKERGKLKNLNVSIPDRKDGGQHFWSKKDDLEITKIYEPSTAKTIPGGMVIGNVPTFRVEATKKGSKDTKRCTIEIRRSSRTNGNGEEAFEDTVKFLRSVYRKDPTLFKGSMWANQTIRDIFHLGEWFNPRECNLLGATTVLVGGRRLAEAENNF